MSRRDIVYNLILFLVLFACGLFAGYSSYKPANESDIEESIWDSKDYDYEKYCEGFQESYVDAYPENFVDGWRQYETDNEG